MKREKNSVVYLAYLTKCSFWFFMHISISDKLHGTLAHASATFKNTSKIFDYMERNFIDQKAIIQEHCDPVYKHVAHLQ